jgi:hypothetical protein
VDAPPKKPNQFLLIVGVVVGSLAGTFAVRSLWKPATMDQTLARTASEINKSLPMMADRETRLDSTSPAPDKTLIYHYTLISLRAADVQKDTFVKLLRPRIVTMYQTSPTMKTLREGGVTLEYQYYDQAGAFVAKFAVSPKDF